MYYLNQLTKIQGNSILNNPEKDHFEMNLKFEEKNQYPFVIHKAKLEQMIDLIEDGPDST